MPSFGQNLTTDKAKAIAQVNATIGAARSLYVTDIPFQDTIYAEKRAEAVAYLMLPIEPPTLDDYPWISDAVGIDAPTAAQVAQLWLNLQDLWTLMARQLETARRQAIVSIEAASSRAEIAAAEAQFAATLAALS